MDDDVTNQSATTASSARPPNTVSDPRRYRSPQTSANSSPVPQNATIATGPKPGSSLSLAQSTQFISRDDASNSGAGPVTPAPPNSTTYDVDSARDVKHEARAKAMSSHHPAMVTLTKTLRENGQGGLSRLDADIKRQKAVCQEMVNGLQDVVQDMVAQLTAELQEKVEAKLEAKYEEMEAKLMKKMEAKYEEKEAEFMKKMEANLQKTQAVEPIQQPAAKLNGNSDSERNNTSSNLHERVGKLEEQSTKVAGSVEHYGKSHAKLSNRLLHVELSQRDMSKDSLDHAQAARQNVEEARQKAEEAIRKIEDFERTIRAEFEVFKSSSLNRQPPSDTDRSLDPPAGNFPDLQARLSILEQQNSAWQSLDNQMRVNTNGLAAVQSQLKGVLVQSMKTDHEALRKSMMDFSQGVWNRLGELTADANSTTQLVENLNQGVWNRLGELAADANSTKQLVERCLQRNQQLTNQAPLVESLQVAIRSLETRYSNISTESLFKNIVQVMNETFPSMETQRQDIQALKEQLTSLADQYTTKDDLLKEMAVLKDDVAKNIDAIRAAEKDANPQALNDVVKRVEEISTRIETIETTQKKHSMDLVQRLEGHSYLCSRVETQLDTVMDLAEKVSELSQLSEEVKKFEPQLADIKKQLTDFELSCSPDTIKKMCEPIQHQTETRIATQIQEVNGFTEMLSTQFTDLKNQVFASRLREPSQPQTNGSCSGPDREDGTASSPQMVQRSPQDLPGPPPESSASPPTLTPNNSDSPPAHAPKASRSMSKPSSSATAPRPQDTSLHIRGTASQKENEKSHPPSSQDQSLSSRVAASRQPSVKVHRPTSQLEITRAPSPLEATPRNSAAQAILNSAKENSKSKKRQRQSSNFDAQENDNHSTDTAPRSSDASPALSSNSDPSRKKRKKAKKDKRTPHNLK